jgi:atypical dual specificity phosphatase
VHCFQGVSRSATIVCAYLIATSDRKMTVDEAISFIQSKRGIACPNTGFRSQLEIYASRFMGTKSKPKSERKSALHRPFLGAILKERICQLTSTQD